LQKLGNLSKKEALSSGFDGVNVKLKYSQWNYVFPRSPWRPIIIQGHLFESKLKSLQIVGVPHSMAANIFASWRSGLVNGMNTRNQPLWNWISPTPFRDINYGWIGPIARLSLWLVGLSMLCWMLLWLKISPNPTILQFVAGYETNLLLPANVAGVRCARNMVDLKNYLKTRPFRSVTPKQFLLQTFAKTIKDKPTYPTRSRIKKTKRF